MKTIGTFYDLLIDQVMNLYLTERRWQKVIERNFKKIHTVALRKALEESRNQSGINESILESIISRFEIRPFSKPNAVSRELINQINHIVVESKNDTVLDAAVIAAHQQMIHYKIANYGSLASYAAILHENEVSQMLYTSLTAEKLIDTQLTKLVSENVTINEKKNFFILMHAQVIN